MSTTDHPVRTSTTLQMTVAEGILIPRGSAFITPAALAALGCHDDDVIVIQGQRATVARIHAWPNDPHPNDTSVPGTTIPSDAIIQMDGIVRQNAGAALGDLVSIHAVAAQPAISVALVPVSGPAALSEEELRHVAQTLRGLVTVAGDLVRVPGMGLAAREFQVFSTNPASAVVLEPGTSLRIQAPGAGAPPRGSIITYEDIGGLGEELQHVRELIECRCATRTLRPARHRGAQGRAALRPARHRQNTDRARGRLGERREFLQRQWP